MVPHCELDDLDTCASFGMKEIVISSMYYSLKWNLRCLRCFFCLSNLFFSIPPQHSKNHPSPFFRAPFFPFRLIKVSPDLKADKGISAFTLALLYGECLAALVGGPGASLKWSRFCDLVAKTSSIHLGEVQ